MKQLLVILLSFILNPSVWAQQDTINSGVESDKVFDFQFYTGTNYIMSQGIGSGANFFFSPGMQINATPKLSLYLSSTIYHPYASNFKPYPVEGLASQPIDNQNNLNVSVFAEGQYKFSDKFSIKGFMYKSPDNLGYQGSFSTNGIYNYFNNLREAYSIGVFYQLTDNIELGAMFQKVDYSPSPFIW